MSFCFRCGGELPQSAKFCPKCGQNLSQQSPLKLLTPKRIALVLTLSALMWSVGWAGSSIKSGTRPTQTMEASSEPEEQAVSDPTIDRLRAETQSKPQDIATWRALANELVTRIRSSQGPQGPLTLEAIEVFKRILEIDNKDPDALMAMADLSFDQQVFDKAVSYYKSYIEIRPNDLSARARYGSALTFVGNFDGAISELTNVLKQDPKNFNANAYLSITYAQKGDKDKAVEIGKRAMEVAPSDEARNRLGTFLDSLNKATPPPSKEETSPDTSMYIVDAVRTNPVAGPKYSSSKLLDGNILAIYMKDFPMEAMPEFAKQKFFSGINAILDAPGSKVSAVVFVDEATGKEMARLTGPTK